MLPTRFSSLAVLKYPKERTDNVNPLNVAREFVSKRFHWQRFLTLPFKVKSFFVASISLKMFWEKGLPQIWTTSLKDVCVVSSFVLHKKPAALLRMNSFICFFFEDFIKILFILFFFFLRCTEICLLESSLNRLMQVITKGHTYLNKLF